MRMQFLSGVPIAFTHELVGYVYSRTERIISSTHSDMVAVDWIDQPTRGKLATAEAV